MKKYRSIIFLTLISCTLCGCKITNTFKYICYLPEVYEARLHVVTGDVTVDYTAIKREITNNSKTYRVSYYSENIQIEGKDPSYTDYLYIWNESEYNWDSYRYIEDEERWGTILFGNPAKDFRDHALYANGCEFNDGNLVSITDEEIILTWGRSNPDDIRLSNNEYHICLYHKYNGTEMLSYHEFTSFIFDKSTGTIPHLDKFNFEKY